MRRRSGKRYFNSADGDALLVQMESCRKACVKVSMSAPIGEDIYVTVHKLMDAIDDVAGVLTGDRAHFHSKMGAPSSASGDPTTGAKPNA